FGIFKCQFVCIRKIFMKRPFFLFACILFQLCCFSQKTTRVDSYVLPAELDEEKLLVIEMPYAKADIVSIKGDTTGFRDAGAVFLDVVCTDFPSTATLKQLNKDRIASLLKKFPFLISKDFAKINLFRQLDGAEKEKAMTMFHGIVIHYYPKQSHHT